MKKLLLLLLIALAAIGLGFLIHTDPGYAMISYQHWMIATSFWVAVATLFLLFIVFYYFLRLMSGISSLPKMFTRRKQFLNAKKYRLFMTLGIAALSNGDAKKAEKCFLKLKKQALLSDDEFQKIQKICSLQAKK